MTNPYAPYDQADALEEINASYGDSGGLKVARDRVDKVEALLAEVAY